MPPPHLDHGERERPLGHEHGAETSEGGELLGGQTSERLELVPETELSSVGVKCEKGVGVGYKGL